MGLSDGTFSGTSAASAARGLVARRVQAGTYDQRLVQDAERIIGAASTPNLDWWNTQVQWWTPDRLFVSSDVAAWYDFSDLTPEKVAFRRNLLLNTEFQGGVSGTPGTAPVSWSYDFSGAGDSLTYTGDTVRYVSTASESFVLRQSIVVSAGDQLTMSAMVRAQASADLNAQWYVGFDGVVAGTNVTRINGVPASTLPVNEWVRVSVTRTFSASGTERAGVGALGSSRPARNFEVREPQLERGAVASPYQRITDFTREFLEAFPTHTLYQNAAGTLPVTALGQPVGLVIDKSLRGLAALGPELITNGDFSNGTTGWAAQSGVSIAAVNDALVVTAVTGPAGAGQSISTVSGRLYQAIYTAIPGTTPCTFRVGTSAGGADIVNAASQSGTVTRYFTALGATTWITLRLNSGSAVGTFNSWDNVSVREVPGTHLVQTTDASRPTLQARKNRLTNTIFNGGVGGSPGTAPTGWTLFAFGTASTAYSGSVASFTATATSRSSLRQTLPVNVGQVDTLSARVRLTSGAATVADVLLNSSSVAGSRIYRLNGATVTSSTALPLNQWVSVELVSTYSATGTSIFAIGVGAGAGATADATVEFEQPQLEYGSTATSYQRVTTATDYADVGVPRGALFDGSDDFLVTAANLNLSGTDEVTVSAGVDKRSDTAGVVTELSASVGFPGTFLLYSSASGNPNYQWVSNGTSLTTLTVSTPASPDTAVMTGQSDVSAPLMLLRRNGSQIGQNTTNQGTGNYSNALLYVGRRGGSNLPFNGRITQLLVLGRRLEEPELSRLERWFGERTGVTW